MLEYNCSPAVLYLQVTYSARAPRADVNGGGTFATERTRPQRIQNEADGIYVGGEMLENSLKQNRDQRYL